MNEHCSFLVLLLDIASKNDLLEVNDQLLRIMFGVCEEFGRVKGEYVVGNGVRSFQQATDN